MGCLALLVASVVGLALGLSNLSYKSPYVHPGIYPAPDTSFIGRRTQVHLPQEQADVAVIFIGGFGDQTTANYRSVYEWMPPLPIPGKQVRAYYAWDGAEGSLFDHNTEEIRQDLAAFLRINPAAHLIFIGHSYGGSATMDVLRHLGATPHGRVLVVTLDAVSCRERSKPRERAAGVDYWVNVYCSPYRHPKDLAAIIGGPWRACPQADVNICFSGKERDAKGRRFQHARPDALFTTQGPNTTISAYELLRHACMQYGL